jgi:hypothetical protein
MGVARLNASPARPCRNGADLNNGYIEDVAMPEDCCALCKANAKCFTYMWFNSTVYGG